MLVLCIVVLVSLLGCVLFLFCTYVCRIVLRTLVFICRVVVGLYFFPLLLSSILCSAHFYFPYVSFLLSCVLLFTCFHCVVNHVRILPSLLLCGLVVYVVGCGDWVVFVHHHYC